MQLTFLIVLLNWCLASRVRLGFSYSLQGLLIDAVGRAATSPEVIKTTISRSNTYYLCELCPLNRRNGARGKGRFGPKRSVCLVLVLNAASAFLPGTMSNQTTGQSRIVLDVYLYISASPAAL